MTTPARRYKSDDELRELAAAKVSSAQRGHGLHRLGSMTRRVAPGLFAVIVANNAARVADNRICWSTEEWSRFCAAARDDEAMRGFVAPDVRTVGIDRLLGTAVYLAVRRVEKMLADGKSANDIRLVMLYLAQKDAGEQEARAVRDRDDAAVSAAADRAKAVAIKREEAIIQYEAREQARQIVAGQHGGGGRRRLAAVPSDE